MNSSNNRSLTVLCCALMLVVGMSALSCVTRNDKFENVDGEVKNQNFLKAFEIIQKNKKGIYNIKKDAVLYYLDTGYLALHGNNIKQSLTRLQEAERLMAEYQKAVISEEAASFLVNDTIISYAGADYEKLYANIGLSLGYLSKGETEKGFVEIRRVQNIINKIQADNYTRIEQYNSADPEIVVNPKNYPLLDSAFARWMSWWLYRHAGDRTNIPVAERNYERAIGIQPQLYYFTPPSMKRWNYDDTKPSLKLVAMTEMIPPLNIYQSYLEVQNQQLVLSSEIRESGDFRGYDVDTLYTGITVSGFESGLTFPISFAKFDEVALRQNRVAGVEIRSGSVDGDLLGTMALIEDVGVIAYETFKFKAPWLYAKQILRLAIKIAGSAALDTAQSGLGAIALITGLALEVPDNRSSRYIPKRIWVGEIDVPQTYAIALVYRDKNGGLLHSELLTGDYKADQLNLRLSSYLQ